MLNKIIIIFSYNSNTMSKNVTYICQADRSGKIRGYKLNRRGKLKRVTNVELCKAVWNCPFDDLKCLKKQFAKHKETDVVKQEIKAAHKSKSARRRTPRLSSMSDTTARNKYGDMDLSLELPPRKAKLDAIRKGWWK